MLNTNNQTQDGGDGATMLQSTNMNVTIIGIDEKRAREIYDEKYEIAKRDFTQEALILANERVAKFEELIIPKLKQYDDQLTMFADPSFHILLIEAQKTAASTEREADYNLLAELLKRRVERGDNRMVRAGIKQAVDIVSEISDEALLGLTVVHSLRCFCPVSGNISKGLDVLNNLYNKLIYGALPEGYDWLDHLDTLGAIRLNSFGSIKKIKEYMPYRLEGYVAVGIKKDSDNYNKALQLLDDVGLNKSILTEHLLNSDYGRLNILDKDSINDLKLVVNQFNQLPLNNHQCDNLRIIYDLYDNTAELIENNKTQFMTEWNNRPYLKMLGEWWDNHSTTFNITAVGRVFAHAYARDRKSVV